MSLFFFGLDSLREGEALISGKNGKASFLATTGTEWIHVLSRDDRFSSSFLFFAVFRFYG